MSVVFGMKIPHSKIIIIALNWVERGKFILELYPRVNLLSLFYTVNRYGSRARGSRPIGVRLVLAIEAENDFSAERVWRENDTKWRLQSPRCPNLEPSIHETQWVSDIWPPQRCTRIPCKSIRRKTERKNKYKIIEAVLQLDWHHCVSLRNYSFHKENTTLTRWIRDQRFKKPFQVPFSMSLWFWTGLHGFCN